MLEFVRLKSPKREGATTCRRGVADPRDVRGIPCTIGKCIAPARLSDLPNPTEHLHRDIHGRFPGFQESRGWQRPRQAHNSAGGGEVGNNIADDRPNEHLLRIPQVGIGWHLEPGAVDDEMRASGDGASTAARPSQRSPERANKQEDRNFEAVARTWETQCQRK